jgi:hypothetical protein
MITLFTPRPNRPHDWLDDHAAAWVEHGLVSSDQIDAIREFEQEQAPEPPRLSVIAELAVYLGSALALMSGAMMVGQAWDSLGLGGQVGIGIAIALLGFVAGTRLLHLDDPGTRRLASFMWLVGTGGVALAAAALAASAEFEEPGWNVLIVGLPVTAAGALLWRNLERPLQVLTTAVGVGLTLGGIGALLSVPPWIGGILIWLTALAIGALATTQRLRPELYVLGVAAIAASIGALMLTDVSEILGPAAATVTAAGIVAVGLARHLVPILVIGVLAFLQALEGLLLATVSGAVAAMGVAVVGLAIVIVVIVRSTRGPKQIGGQHAANL